jgi:hypothetical protein
MVHSLPVLPTLPREPAWPATGSGNPDRNMRVGMFNQKGWPVMLHLLISLHSG